MLERSISTRRVENPAGVTLHIPTARWHGLSAAWVRSRGVRRLREIAAYCYAGCISAEHTRRGLKNGQGAEQGGRIGGEGREGGDVRGDMWETKRVKKKKMTGRERIDRRERENVKDSGKKRVRKTEMTHSYQYWQTIAPQWLHYHVLCVFVCFVWEAWGLDNWPNDLSRGGEQWQQAPLNFHQVLHY